MKKRMLALVLSMICILMFAGCSSTEFSLISAFQKDAQMTSVKTTEVLSGKMNITLPEELREDTDEVNVQSILNMLSSFRLESTTEQKRKGDNVSAKFNYAILSEDLSFSGELYTIANNNQARTVFKIPTLFKAMLPQRYENAVYATMDTSELPKLAEKQQERNNLYAEYYGEDVYLEETFPSTVPENTISKALQLNDNTFDFIKSYAQFMEDSPKLVTKSKNTYTLTITDEAFKDLLRSAVITYFDYPEAREEVYALWDAIRTYICSVNPTLASEEFPALPQLPEDQFTVSNLKLQAELIFNLLDDVRLIGKDGIRIVYTLNSAGYIADIQADIHLDFDINAITELLSGEAYYEDDFAFEIRLQYHQKRQNINHVADITFPTLTEENNLSLYTMIADGMQDEIDRLKEEIKLSESYGDDGYDAWEDDIILPAPDGSISILNDFGDWRTLVVLDENAPLINENGTLYAPLEPLMDWLGADYSWNEDTKMIVFSDPMTDKSLQYRPGDSVIVGEDYSITLSAPTMVKDGQDYLPLRAMVSAFSDCTVTWNAQEHAVYLRPWYYGE